MTEELKLRYHSIRSDKARISVLFNHRRTLALRILSGILAVIGIYAVYKGLAIGWFISGMAAAPIVLSEWYDGELHHMKISKNQRTIDDVLSADILGRISKRPTPTELAGIVGLIAGGRFLAARFGISNQFIRDISSSDEKDMQKVWQEAWKIRKETNSKNISATILVTALIRCSENGEKLLSHLQLGTDDLISGIEWYNHLRMMIDEARKVRMTGGLARDWSFGWTPLLNRFGQNISRSINPYDLSVHQLNSHDEVLAKMMEIYQKDGRQNVALVGPSGVGKTQLVHTFASRLLDAESKVPSKIRFNQVFILDAASLIAAAPKRGGLEDLVPRLLSEAYRAKNIIICLDNAELFFEEGIGSVDITNVMLPVLRDGDIRLILTMDDQKYLRISKREPQLAANLNRILIGQATRHETIAVMQDRAIMFEFQNHVTYMYQALTEIYRLSERYIHDIAMPGKALQLMESSALYNENGLVTARSVQLAIEKTMGIKVGVASADEERDILLNLEDLIHKRMVNQKRAVNVVSDALRRARSGVRNQNRPIGTFLFLGPTGVGKTELSKALAEVYFGGEDRMIRLDMNEYSQAEDAGRLIADGVNNPNSLTALVMKQPFSVVLLDEIEKAHPNVLSVLLQMLDEGVLRDVSNREVSFKDAIVIATSNAGADRIREYIDRGYNIEQFEAKFVDELIKSNQFKSEFLNRFDEIVMFRPLNKDELLRVVDLILDGVNKTLSLQKVSVNVSDEAKKYLVEVGYDPRLGARPMRRVVQRAVENNIAKKMLSGNVEPGSVIELSINDVKQTLDSQAATDRLTSNV
ncbi:ATP-dependent Clp protease ATP-binding subunit [Candidatus Saccharibacteria bacterium]|nr:ATP-dependent Clp protease ATP-binding subunit [Candidatus Saccharibacteria bacterium]